MKKVDIKPLYPDSRPAPAPAPAGASEREDTHESNPKGTTKEAAACLMKIFFSAATMFDLPHQTNRRLKFVGPDFSEQFHCTALTI